MVDENIFNFQLDFYFSCRKQKLYISDLVDFLNKY